MKKNFILFAAVVVTLLAASCKKESINQPEEEIIYGKTMFEVTVAEDSRMNAPSVNPNGMSQMTHMDGFYTIWDNEDQIRINGENFTTYQQTNKTVKFWSDEIIVETPYRAFYPKELQSENYDGSTSGTLPSTYTHDITKVILPMYAESNNNTLAFHNICAVLKIMIPGNVTQVTVTCNDQHPLYGDFTVEGDGTKDNPYKAVMGTNENCTTITINPKEGDTYLDDAKPVYIPIPAETYSSITVTFNGRSDIWNNGTKTLTNFTAIVNKFYSLNADPKLLPKRFKVSDTKFVYFAKGNLYKRGNTFGIESHQTDRTTGTDFTNHFMFSENINGSNKITIDTTQGLYNLSKDEWLYLTGTKVVAADIPITDSHTACDIKTIEGIECLVVAPYGQTSIPTTYTTLAEYTNNGYLVLPNIGYYNGNFFTSADTRYWTSTEAESNAWTMTFGGTYALQYGKGGKTLKRAIRLAKDAQ